MKFAYDVPGYLAGFRFANDNRVFDGSRFLDLAGYQNHADIVVGTPTFQNVGPQSKQALLLNNACQLSLDPPIPWEGTMLIVHRATFASLGIGKRLTAFLFGNLFGTGDWFLQGCAAYQESGGSVNLVSGGPTAGIFVNSTQAIGATVVTALAWDQETRKCYVSQDCVSITESSAATSGTGYTIAPGGGLLSSAEGLTGSVAMRKLRIGNNACATGATTTPDANDYLHLFEMHFFRGNALRGDRLAALKSFRDSLAGQYM